MDISSDQVNGNSYVLKQKGNKERAHKRALGPQSTMDIIWILYKVNRSRRDGLCMKQPNAEDMFHSMNKAH